MTIGDSNAAASTARAIFYDFSKYAVTPNPKWPGTRAVVFDQGTSGPVALGSLRHANRPDHPGDFRFEVDTNNETIQFTSPWHSKPFHANEQSALCAWFRLLTGTWDERQNPQGIFATGAGPLSGFEVHPHSTVDIGPCILCQDGKQRVLVYVTTLAMEELFPSATKSDYNVLVDDTNNNRPAFERIACIKYYRHDWEHYQTQGQTFPRIIITHLDIENSGETFSATVLQAKVQTLDLRGAY